MHRSSAHGMSPPLNNSIFTTPSISSVAANTNPQRFATLLKIKCLLGDEMRVLTVPTNITFSQLQQRLLEMYSFYVDVLFEDAEGDLVSVKSQYEVDEAIGLFRRHAGSQSLRLYLTRSNDNSTRFQEEDVPLEVDEQESDIFSEYEKRADPEFFESIEYLRGQLLGSGAFGQVFSALHAETGVLMAMKEIKLASMSTVDSEKQMNLLKNEIRTFSGVRHPHLVQYLGVQIQNDSFCIFMEFVAGGSIASLLQSFGALGDSIVRRYTHQILLGLEYLHRNRIVHRDIKGANILIDATGMVKLADFGAATRLQTMKNASMLKSVKGTPYWMAPEVIHQSGHGRKSDIWSVGCTVYEMLNGSPPWSHLEPMSALFHIGTTTEPPPLPPSFSPQVTDFILRCLNRF